MRQLDGALAAASQRAVAVAAAGRELEQRLEQGGGNAASVTNDAGAGSELIAAMGRERCRLQQQERLREALQEGGAAVQQGQGSGLSRQQELLLEALLSGTPEQGDGTLRNPYAEAAGELSASDDALAALGGSSAESGAERQQASAAAKPPALDVACPARSECQEGNEDLAAAREGILRCGVLRLLWRGQRREAARRPAGLLVHAHHV